MNDDMKEIIWISFGPLIFTSVALTMAHALLPAFQGLFVFINWDSYSVGLILYHLRSWFSIMIHFRLIWFQADVLVHFINHLSAAFDWHTNNKEKFQLAVMHLLVMFVCCFAPEEVPLFLHHVAASSFHLSLYSLKEFSWFVYVY